MSTVFPSSIDAFANPVGTDLLENANPALDHDVQHSNANDAIEALEAKVGANNSAVTSSHDYKLSGIPDGQKALSSGAATPQSITNLTLVTPTFTLGGDTTGDMFYRSSGGGITRLPIGTSGQIIQTSAGGIPEWTSNPSASDASTTVKGVVEEATQAEVIAGTSTGATGARLFVNPSTFGSAINNYVTVNPTTFGIGSSTTASGNITALDYVYANGAGTSKRIQLSAFNTQSTPTTALTNGSYTTKAFRYNSTKQIYFTGGSAADISTMYAVIGTVNAGETDLSFASSTIEASCYGFDVAEVSVGTYLVIYRTATLVKVRVITYDGTTLTVGGSTTIESTTATGIYPSCARLDASRVLIAYDENTTGYLKTQVLSISGTTITTNTPNTVTALALAASSGHSIVMCNADTDKTLVLYSYYNGANYLGKSAIITTSGTTVSSYGAEVTVYTLGSGSNHAKLYKVGTNRAITFYRDASVSTNKWLSTIVTVSGTTPTYNTGTQISVSTTQIVYGPAVTIVDTLAFKALITTSEDTSSSMILADLSGTIISILSTSTAFATGAYNAIVKLRPYVYGYYGSNNKQILVLSTVEQKTRVGVASADIASSATGSINLPYKVLTGFTGLTPATLYYIDDNGTYTTELSVVAANKEYGVSLNTTSMLIK